MLSKALTIGAVAVAACALGGGARATEQSAFNGRIAFVESTGIGSMNPDGSGLWGVDYVLGDTAPAWSPDGTRLAFVSQRNGDADIYTMAPDGSDQRELTFSNAWDTDPAWSPDGKQIAFVSYRGGNEGIYFMNADGSDQHLAVGDIGYPSHLSWSPDGKSIVFQTYYYDYETGRELTGLWIAQGASAHPLLLGSDNDPAWSPDGTRIAFDGSRDDPGNQDVYVMNADGTGVRRLTSDLADDSHPAWAPDGSAIAFQSERDGKRNPQIYTMAPDGSNVRRLTYGDATQLPSWQPLGPPPARCTLWGTAADDLLVGGDGSDTICGEAGNDTLIGGGGNDELFGGDGNDFLAGGPGWDIFNGDAGDDRIDARDGIREFVRGGSGNDSVIEDWSGEVLSGIESKTRSLDVAAWRPIQGSTYELTNPFAMANDGNPNDWWNSGGTAPKSIEIDLGVTNVASIRLTASPQGTHAINVVLGERVGQTTWRQLHEFDGPFSAGQVLYFKPKRPWRRLQAIRVESRTSGDAPDWIAWQEIEVFAPRK
jgi:Ca2+-binding RTX toxin-like protein